MTFSTNLGAITKVFGLIAPSKRRRLVGIFLLMVLTTLLEVLNVGMFLPVTQAVLDPTGISDLPVVGDLLHAYIETMPGSPLAVLGVTLIAIFIVKNVLIGFAVYLQSIFTSRIQADLIKRLIGAYTRKPYEEHLHVNSANAVHDISQTVPSAVSGILQSSLGLVLEVLLSLGAVVVLFAVSFEAALAAAAFVTGALFLYYAIVRRRLYHLGKHALDVGKAISRWSHFCLGATKENLILGKASYFVDRIGALAHEQARISAFIATIGQLPRLYGEVVIVCAMLLVVALIVGDKGSAEASVPVLAVFAAAAFRVFPAANRIVHYASGLRQCAPLLDAVYDDFVRDLIDAPPAVPADRRIPATKFEREIRLDGVSYRYPQAADMSLRDISLTIEKGQAVAFVGPTGAGKTTIVDIILGILPPTAGEIFIDGQAVTPNADFWRGRIGYVPQTIFLLDDTLRRNIALGIPDAEIDDDRVAEVIRIAQLDSVVSGMAHGLDTGLGERGVRISGGQRQRIGIARALYDDPDILVFDEATSALDSGTEQEITTAIEGLTGQKTLIVIAHRLGTVRACDTLFYLDKGRLTGVGSSDELVAENAGFRMLAELSNFSSNPADEPTAATIRENITNE